MPLTNPLITDYKEGVQAIAPSATSSTCTSYSISTTTYTCTTAGAGTVAVGQTLTGTGITAGTTIVSNIAGSGSGSTWTVNISQTASTGTATGAPGAYITPVAGTWAKVTTASALTVTLPPLTLDSSVGGKSFTVTVCYGGAHAVTWRTFLGATFAGWSNTNTAPTQTQVSGQCDDFVFGILPSGAAMSGGSGLNHYTGS